MNKDFINVLLSISVPNSIYCWDWRRGAARCEHFKSGDCKFGFKPIFDTENGIYIKDKKCRCLIFEENNR